MDTGKIEVVLTEHQNMVGRRVVYRLYVRPYHCAVGTIIEQRDDRQGKKPKLYIIKPESSLERQQSTVLRYHPTRREDGGLVFDIEDVVIFLGEKEEFDADAANAPGLFDSYWADLPKVR